MAGAFALSALFSPQADGQLEVQLDEVLPNGGGNDLTFSVQDLSILPGGLPPSGYNGLVLQYSSDLLQWTTAQPNEFTLNPATSTTPPVGGAWTASLSFLGDGGFFRFQGVVTTADDIDGDGIPNGYENSPFGTADTSFDTDGDTFSDGLELLYGTDPNDATETPDLTTEPRAEFESAMSQSVEGVPGTHDVTITFDQPFYGTLNYAIGSESTVTAGVDYQSLPGSIVASGTSVVIPITWIDDDQISPNRLLFLQIEGGSGYARAGRTRHMILLGENDAWWEGVVADKYAQRNFRLKITNDANGTDACFAAGSGIDGLPPLEGETPGLESDQSVGIIPDGVFPVTVVSYTPSNFEINSPPLPATTGGLFGPSTGLSRTLELKSIPSSSPPNDDQIGPSRIIGKYTECLAFPGQASCAEQTGTFVLIKQLSDPPEVTP